VWFASELVKFDSYGATPGAVPRLGFALGPAPLGPKRFSTSLGSMPTLTADQILELLGRGELNVEGVRKLIVVRAAHNY